MAAVFAFLGMLLLSVVVALLAAFQLGDFFRASDEFTLIITVIVIFATASIAVFAIAYGVAKRVRAINALALALALLAVALVTLPRLVERIAERSTNPFVVGIENAHITLELLIPALLTVLVQWGLVRRRWLRAAGEEDLTRWPWVTTALAGLLILNPLGLSFVWSALRPGAADLLHEFVRAVTAAGAGALVVMAAVECYIRGRMLRRRLSASLPPAAEAGPQS
jgi:hypothetical protein